MVSASAGLLKYCRSALPLRCVNSNREVISGILMGQFLLSLLQLTGSLECMQWIMKYVLLFNISHLHQLLVTIFHWLKFEMTFNGFMLKGCCNIFLSFGCFLCVVF